MKYLDSSELANSLTFIKEFILDEQKEYKTFDELVSLFEKYYPKMDPIHDKSNDLRSICFILDMKNENWHDDIFLIRQDFEGQRLITDGIHRGIAYLFCVKHGVVESKLPKVYIIEH